MSRCREPKDCSLLREDYLDCLHHSKEFQRRDRIYKEEQRKLRAAAQKADGGGGTEKSSLASRSPLASSTKQTLEAHNKNMYECILSFVVLLLLACLVFFIK